MCCDACVYNNGQVGLPMITSQLREREEYVSAFNAENRALPTAADLINFAPTQQLFASKQAKRKQQF